MPESGFSFFGSSGFESSGFAASAFGFFPLGPASLAPFGFSPGICPFDGSGLPGCVEAPCFSPEGGLPGRASAGGAVASEGWDVVVGGWPGGAGGGGAFP